MADAPKEPIQVPWPNQHEIVDGVTPTEKVPQIVDLFDDSDLDKEMEV